MIASSCHGLSIALVSKTRKERIFWGIVFVLTISYCAYQTGNIVKKYQKYGFTVEYELFGGVVPFPAVSFCNLNAVKKSALATVQELVSLREAYKLIVNAMTGGASDGAGVRNRRQVTCSTFAIAANGNVAFNSSAPHSEGTTAVVTCDTNYISVPADFYQCDLSGSWGLALPQCLLSCSHVETMCTAYGGFTSFGQGMCYGTHHVALPFGTALQTCDAGGGTLFIPDTPWAIQHPAKLAQNFLAHLPISCLYPCYWLVNGGKPASDPNMLLSNYDIYENYSQLVFQTQHLTLDNTFYSTTMDLTQPIPGNTVNDCLKLELYTGVVSELHCDNGWTWFICQYVMPSCVYECDSLTVANGTVAYSSTPILEGVTASFTCAPGFYRRGTIGNLTCSTYGEWDLAPPVCGPVCSSRVSDCDTLAPTSVNYFSKPDQYCYYFSSTALKYWECSDYCVAGGGQLAVFRTAESYYALEETASVCYYLLQFFPIL